LQQQQLLARGAVGMTSPLTAASYDSQLLLDACIDDDFDWDKLL